MMLTLSHVQIPTQCIFNLARIIQVTISKFGQNYLQAKIVEWICLYLTKLPLLDTQENMVYMK